MAHGRNDLLPLAAALGFLGVAAGTFGAHGLERVATDPKALAWWETGVLYHLVHALAAVLAALLIRAAVSAGAAPPRAARAALIAFALGVLVFSGSLYAMALGAPRALGMITPLGGVSFLVGWVCLARAR